MQGKKKFTPKLFVNFRLDEQVPDDNFYKILKNHLKLDFIYKETQDVYSHTGRPGIDPVVFFKMLLVGYLENIANDRALERLFQLRLDLLFFIDHDLGDSVPDHSTICKTRKRIPKHVFDKVFNHILKLCIDAGLVEGKTQSIDSAYISANASLDTMERKLLVDRDPDDFIREVFLSKTRSNVFRKNKMILSDMLRIEKSNLIKFTAPLKKIKGELSAMPLM